MTALVPELYCRDLTKSLIAYTGVFGFTKKFGREGFVYLTRGDAELMLEQITVDSWLAAPAEPPLGRGINLQIEVENLAALVSRAKAAQTPVFRPLEEVWYKTGRSLTGQRQIVLQDPDGYLLRFCQPLPPGTNPAAKARFVR